MVLGQGSRFPSFLYTLRLFFVCLLNCLIHLSGSVVYLFSPGNNVGSQAMTLLWIPWLVWDLRPAQRCLPSRCCSWAGQALMLFWMHCWDCVPLVLTWNCGFSLGTELPTAGTGVVWRQYLRCQWFARLHPWTFEWNYLQNRFLLEMWAWQNKNIQ